MFDLVPNTSLAIINRCVLLITWWVVLLKLYLVSVKQLISWVLLANFSHCVKMSVFGVFLVRISAFGPTAWKVSKYGVFSGLHFPAFGLNTNLRIYFEYRKIGARKNSVFAHFSRSDWIRRLNIQFFSRSDWIFSLVTGKFRPEKLRIRAHFRQCLLWGKTLLEVSISNLTDGRGWALGLNHFERIPELSGPNWQCAVINSG